MHTAVRGAIWPVTCLLCISILNASIDRVPDPPALKTERIDAKSDCRTGEALPALASAAEATSRTTGYAVLRWFACRQAPDPACSYAAVALVLHAADPSPPDF